MPVFDEENLRTEYRDKGYELKDHLNNIYNIVLESKVSLEGNSFYHNKTLNIYPELLTKQINLFWCGKQATTRICEIGFNAGHSTLLMLLGREKTPLEFTIFDIGHHAYTLPSLNYIQSKFENVQFEYIEGDSTKEMPKWIDNHKDFVGTYDVVHVDGGHTLHCIVNDMKNADVLVRVGGIIIIDDTYVNYINDQVNLYINNGNYKELDILKTIGYTHRIIKKIK
jgi:hypothetical protein